MQFCLELWVNEWLFFHHLQEHLGASHNVRRTLRRSSVHGKQAHSGIVTITWWASHRSSKASVWSSTCRLHTSPPESLNTLTFPLSHCWQYVSPVLLCDAVKVQEVARDGHGELRNTLCTLNNHWKPAWGIILNCCLPRTQRRPQHTRARIHARTRTPPLLRRSNRTFWRQFKPSARVAHFGPGERECDTRPLGSTTWTPTKEMT